MNGRISATKIGVASTWRIKTVSKMRREIVRTLICVQFYDWQRVLTGCSGVLAVTIRHGRNFGKEMAIAYVVGDEAIVGHGSSQQPCNWCIRKEVLVGGTWTAAKIMVSDASHTAISVWLWRLSYLPPVIRSHLMNASIDFVMRMITNFTGIWRWYWSKLVLAWARKHLVLVL